MPFRTLADKLCLFQVELDQMRATVDDMSQTVVMVTHDPRAAGYADRVLFLADGRLVHELRGPTTDSVLDTIRNLGD